MATDADLRARGYVLPQGGEAMMYGDDAIRANASAAYDQAENVRAEGRTGRQSLTSRVDTLSQLARDGANIYPLRAATTGEDSTQWRARATITIGSDALAKTIVGAPPDARMGTARVHVIGGIVAHEWIEQYRSAAAGPPRYWYRATKALGPVTFSDWIDLTSRESATAIKAVTDRVTVLETATTSTGTASDAGISHQMMQDTHRRRRGGVIGTAGRAPIALRFDHGFAKFQPILDLLRRYQLPATQACFAHQFDAEGAQHTLNNGWTWPMIEAAGLADGLEVANHSSTHKDATDSLGLIDEIVQGRNDLRAALPLLAVDGWITPGVGGTNYRDGWNTTPDLEKWSGTEAGRLVLAHHAWAEGYTPGEYHVLDGTIRAGRHSWTIDTTDRAAEVEAMIDRAIEQRVGVNFMLHPANVGGAGMVDLARVEQILAYIAGKRDAGLIEVLTLGGWMMADTRSDHRPSPLRPLGTGGWDMAGQPVAGGVATITAPISQVTSLSHQEQLKGGIWEARAEVRSPAGGTLTLTVTDSSGALSTTTTATLPASQTWQTIRRPFTIPRTRTTSLTTRIEPTGTVEIRAPRWAGI